MKVTDFIPGFWIIRFIPLMLAGMGLFAGQVHPRTVFQAMPVLSITEEYQDNFFSTQTGKQEEFITAYALQFTAGIFHERHQLFLSYSPTYKDYKNLDDRDRLNHYVTVEGNMSPAKHTDLSYGLAYDGNSDEFSGETRRHQAFVSGTTQAKKKHPPYLWSHLCGSV